MHVKNTRRILCFGPPGCHALQFLNDLTGSQPAAQEDGSIVGLSHELQIRTQYYDADIDVWIDEVADPEAWTEGFSQLEAREVVKAIAAYIICFTDDGTEECLKRFQLLLETVPLLEAVPEVNAADEDEINGAERLAVITQDDLKTALPAERLEQFMELADSYSFELVDHYATGKNEFMEKQGIERVKEVLEAVDWAVAGPQDETDELKDLDFEHPDAHVDLDALKESLLNPDEVSATAEEPDEALAVDDLEVMLGKLLAVKEQAAGLPLEQRKRLAAKAVRDVMQQTGR